MKATCANGHNAYLLDHYCRECGAGVTITYEHSCPHCGSENQKGDKYCCQCGSTLMAKE